jgi:hypothetical protein
MEEAMDKTGPQRRAWWIALVIWAGVIVGLVGILGSLLPIAALSGSSFWLLAVGWLLLSIATGAIYIGGLVKW